MLLTQHRQPHIADEYVVAVAVSLEQAYGSVCLVARLQAVEHMFCLRPHSVLSLLRLAREPPGEVEVEPVDVRTQGGDVIIGVLQHRRSTL